VFSTAKDMQSNLFRFNMRTAHGIYRNLQQFLEEMDKDGFDEDTDMDFRSVSASGTRTFGTDAL
jgi:hypothetical protein